MEFKLRRAAELLVEAETTCKGLQTRFEAAKWGLEQAALVDSGATAIDEAFHHHFQATVVNFNSAANIRKWDLDLLLGLTSNEMKDLMDYINRYGPDRIPAVFQSRLLP